MFFSCPILKKGSKKNSSEEGIAKDEEVLQGE
jgi:hypothetical protein